ncbi:MAG: cryptochrome/photolyase family protein [Gammaproteobacteria bacterium]|nr:cryptochrome/photolyase family protein [Gammaproteobacteria bacterium]
MRSARKLLLVLGDQLDPGMDALDNLDREKDAILMAEVREEAEVAPSHRQRTTLFLAAMRHFALELIDKGFRVRYVQLDSSANTQALGPELARAISTLNPECVQVVQPGDHRVEASLVKVAREKDVPLNIMEDESFTCTLDEFNAWASDGRKSLVMEYFYRERRRALNVLVEGNGKPVGGKWNFDDENRKSFKNPPDIPRPYQPRPDEITREVMALVERTWPDAWGRMDSFHWPVTRDEALRALRDFVDNRLASFGDYEDAMWAGEPVLYHSRIASCLNLKLIRPRECVDAAIAAYEDGRAAINNVEGFVRQIIGWREFIRGVYYREGADYSKRNGLRQQGDLPRFYWTGETEMNCMSHCLNEVLDNGWGHHIPRLMVLGNFAMTSGVNPAQVNEWFLAMYVDAVDWVTAPNVIGMSQHADHAVVGTKPYAGSANYINRMSNYCKGCKYNPKQRKGEDACPFNVFYWDFMIRHRKRFADNRRMQIALKNVDRLPDDERKAIRKAAQRLHAEFEIKKRASSQ